MYIRNGKVWYIIPRQYVNGKFIRGWTILVLCYFTVDTLEKMHGRRSVSPVIGDRVGSAISSACYSKLSNGDILISRTTRTRNKWQQRKWRLRVKRQQQQHLNPISSDSRAPETKESQTSWPAQPPGWPVAETNSKKHSEALILAGT